ncbi:hypothetical protein EJ04DRAFT_239040 [Polyplosphaeria fusca]|uniref:Uncharacterized protein n=1 Tax=Polyplosphaeria fusca TaxID=682080 RepID=A0A9P4RB50_9PLEO|nr:hypothetical protein EJ04DRAFT_239040 [Polyplosphaeria fusca]
MAQIALPRQQVTQASQSTDVGSPLYQRRRTSNAGPIELVPNPDFTFPQRGPDTQAPDSAPVSQTQPMSLQAYPTGRRGSTPGQRQKSLNALPDFSFNPAPSTVPAPSNLTPDGLSTPPHSPLATSPTTPSRPIGHRRGGSEFIGGDGRTGGAPLLSSSPTRSGAVSSHDLSSIMNPPATRAGSAPVTPMEGEPFAFGHSVNKSISQPSLRDNSFFPDDLSSPRRPPSRARVGFSDKVEIIRPLSTISSETETSLSTMRGHSATGSISSVISAGTSSPQSARLGRPSLNITFEDEPRPSTAGAVLDLTKSAHQGVDVLNRKRPMSAVSPGSPTIVSPTSPRVPAKRRGFFRLESRRSDPTVTTLHASASDPALAVAQASPLPSPLDDEDDAANNEEKAKSTLRKATRKPRKVKSWANSIISRKGKHSSKAKRRAPTPPPEPGVDSEDTDESEELDFEANFDVDNTVTIVSPSESSTEGRKTESDIASWKPREFKKVNSDSMSPVIDLDAALGPFNTPHGSSPRGQQRGFGAHRRAMHSASGLTQTHRRTESAPALVPFELRNTTTTTASTMADVFEEEEPEDESAASKQQPKVEDAVEDEPKIQIVEADHTQSGTAINWDFNDGLKITRSDRALKTDVLEPLSPHAIPGTDNRSEQPTAPSPIDVVEDHEEPRSSSLTHSSDSTVTPQMNTDEPKEAQPLMNIPLALPQQSLPTPTTFASSFSSPDFRSSQASLDTPRLGTAASSVTDYRLRHGLPSERCGIAPSKAVQHCQSV